MMFMTFHLLKKMEITNLEMGIDITERKHAETELQNSKDKLEDLVKKELWNYIKVKRNIEESLKIQQM